MIDVRKTETGYEVVHADGAVLFRHPDHATALARASILSSLAKRRGNKPKADELLVLFPPTAPEPLIFSASHALASGVGKREDVYEPASGTWTMRNVEVFREGAALKQVRGEWKKLEFTADDVIEFVEAFAELEWQPPVKITHGSDQAMVLDTLPTIARATALRAAEVTRKRDGRSVLAALADLEKVPPALYEAIRDGKFPQRSIEFWRGAIPRIRGEGSYPMALKAIALLGDELPAVRGMPALDVAPAKFEAGAESTQVQFSIQEQDPVSNPNPNPGSGAAVITLTAEEYQKQKQEFESLKLAAEASKTEIENLRKQTARLAMDRTIESATTLAARFRSEGKITPAQEPIVLEILKGLDDETKDTVTVTLSAESGTPKVEKFSARAAFAHFLSTLPKHPNAPGAPGTGGAGSELPGTGGGFASLGVEEQNDKVAELGEKYFADKAKGFPTLIAAYQQAQSDLRKGV